MVYKLLSVRSYIKYIIVYINSISLSFIALFILIPHLYLLAITAYSSSIYAIVVSIIDIKVGIKVIINLKKLGLRFNVKVYIYILLTNL